MENLLVLNDYITPPPAKYDIDYSSVNGAEVQTETGSTYIERIASQKPTINVAWKNLLESEVTAILNEVKDATISVTYWFGGEHTADMTCSKQKMTLKMDTHAHYYDLSFTLTC